MLIQKTFCRREHWNRLAFVCNRESKAQSSKSYCTNSGDEMFSEKQQLNNGKYYWCTSVWLRLEWTPQDKIQHALPHKIRFFSSHFSKILWLWFCYWRKNPNIYIPSTIDAMIPFLPFLASMPNFSETSNIFLLLFLSWHFQSEMDSAESEMGKVGWTDKNAVSWGGH